MPCVAHRPIVFSSRCSCCSAQVRVIVQGFFSYNQDPQQFKEHVRDFLVQCKVRLRSEWWQEERRDLGCGGGCWLRRLLLAAVGGGGAPWARPCARLPLMFLHLLSRQEVVGEDLSGLYLAERQEALQRAQQEKMTQYAAIPGMLNPHMNSSSMDGNLNDDD